MINCGFLRRVLFLSLLAVTPLAGTEAAPVQQKEIESGIYAKVFSLGKVAGRSYFMNTGLDYQHSDSTGRSGPMALDGTVSSEPRFKHDFSIRSAGFGIGYEVQDTRFELEGLVGSTGKIWDRTPFFALTRITNLDPGNTEYLRYIDFAVVGPMVFNNFSYKAMLLSVYRNFSAGEIIKLYIGTGVGISHTNYDLTETQSIGTRPLVAQGKIGLHFNSSKLKSVGIAPYLGYTALYFAEKETKDSIPGLNVYRIQNKTYVGSQAITSPVKGVNFSPIASHLLHTFELGITFLFNI